MNTMNSTTEKSKELEGIAKGVLNANEEEVLKKIIKGIEDNNTEQSWITIDISSYFDELVKEEGIKKDDEESLVKCYLAELVATKLSKNYEIVVFDNYLHIEKYPTKKESIEVEDKPIKELKCYEKIIVAMHVVSRLSTFINSAFLLFCILTNFNNGRSVILIEVIVVVLSAAVCIWSYAQIREINNKK